MAENQEPFPPGPHAYTDKNGAIWLNEAVLRWLETREFGTVTQIGGIISGNAEVVAAQQVAQAQAAAAIAAANAAAQAAIAASGSTETDQDSASALTVNSGTYATFLTCNLDHAGGGDYTVTTSAGITTSTPAALVTGSGTFSGEWQIIENPNAHVLASGTFTATSDFQGGEGGVAFYLNQIAFSGTFPEAGATYGDNETGPVTVELQLRRASGTNAVSEIFASLLTVWTP